MPGVRPRAPVWAHTTPTRSTPALIAIEAPAPVEHGGREAVEFNTGLGQMFV
jgi:hypothetical protein